MTADEVIAQAAQLVDQPVIIEGQVLGVCHHSHRKAFVQASNDQVVFIAASDAMEEFSEDCVGQTVRFTGIMRAFTPEPAPAVEEVATEEAVPAQEEVAAEAPAQEEVTAEAAPAEGECNAEEHECCKHEHKMAQAETIYYIEATAYEIVSE